MAVTAETADRAAAPPAPARRGSHPGWRKWLAIGSGVGIEVGAEDLRVVAARVRPTGVEVVGTHTIAGFAARPASEWGSEYAAFLRKLGMRRRPAVVLLPRHELVVRHMALPGVEDRDLESAISFQIDSLHPYAEGEAAWCWARLAGTPNVVVGVTRADVVERYWTLFVEAGIAVSSFTFAAAALYSASRLLAAPRAEFFALRSSDGMLEVYGESASRPVFSGVFDQPVERIAPRIRSELRLDPESEPAAQAGLLPAPRRAPEGFDRESGVAPLAAAMTAACPWRALPANLLPAERRAQTSRLIFAPTAALLVLLTAAAALYSWQQSWEDRQYLARLDEQARALERQAAQATQLDSQAAALRERIALIGRFRQRTRADLDALREITVLLQPPAWLQSLSMNRVDVTISGEAEGSAALLELFDQSPLFRGSRFAQGMTRSGGGENFFIRSEREGAGVGEEPEQ